MSGHIVCSNQLQQLLVSVSKHFYLQKNGLFKYQEKPLQVSTANVWKSKKRHLVYYVLLDRFSGNFFYEVAVSSSLIPLADFLHYAWCAEKEDDHFHGMPEVISVPKLISLPGLSAGLRGLGVEVIHPSSGFASGIHIIKELEDNIAFYLGQLSIQSLEALRRLKKKVYRYKLQPYSGEDKILKWRENLPQGHPRAVGPYHEFKQYFPEPGEETPGSLMLRSESPQQYPAERPPLRTFFDEPISDVKYDPEKLDKAQDYVFEAWNKDYRQDLIGMACKALSISLYCADAYNLLAWESRDLQEKLFLFKKGITAAELSLGELFFWENEGNFWNVIEARPYMRSLEGLARCYWEMGDLEQAIELFYELLRLNPGDNQGIRYLLACSLLEGGRDAEFAEFIEEHGDEASCFMVYSEALWAFRTGDPWKDGRLREALAENSYVPPYLLGEKWVPYRLPASYSHGSEEEAVLYAKEARAAWKNNAEALVWLKEMTAAFNGEP
ncbi:MAG: tetratricopeptide repeat protein [Bacillota bacterium]|nr:tetratricopeptide repeat protein [Bacillota bacterium]